MSNEIDDANEFGRLTEKAPVGTYDAPRGSDNPALSPKGSDAEEPSHGAATQWAIYGPGYKPTTRTVPVLVPGCYDICADQHGVFATPSLPPSGLLLELPEMRSEHVLGLVERFWDSEADYKTGNEFIHGGAAYRCGVMLYGPPGSGKSTTIKLVSKKLIARGGTVFFADIHPANVISFLIDFARIERNRKSVVILEDIDSLIECFGESNYLQMLDSAKTIDNVLFVATTNYPEKLDQRIYNRPGRFSHVVKIGLPTAAARAAYLKSVLKNYRDVDKIVSLTEGFSVDHLASLVSAVYREKKELEAEITRLRALFKVPKVVDTGPLGI